MGTAFIHRSLETHGLPTGVHSTLLGQRWLPIRRNRGFSQHWSQCISHGPLLSKVRAKLMLSSPLHRRVSPLS